MSGLAYCGTGAPEWCSCEVLEPAAHELSPRAVEVPGLPGAKLSGSEIPPREVTVRLWPDLGPDADPREIEAAKRELRRWLLAPGGGALSLPEGIEYRDAVVTEAGAWPSRSGYADVTFTCFDPIGYGAEVTSAGGAFNLGGNWPSLPTVRGKSDGAGYVSVTYCGANAPGVGVRYGFAEGDDAFLDFEGKLVTVNGKDCSAFVDLESDWFAIGPGTARLEVSGLSDWTATCRERWV